MMDIHSLIFGAAMVVICVGSYDVVREANAAPLREFFEREQGSRNCP